MSLAFERERALDPQPRNSTRMAAEVVPSSRQAWALLIAIIGLLIFFALAAWLAWRGHRLERELADARNEIQRLNDYSAQQQETAEKILKQNDELAEWKLRAIGQMELAGFALQTCAQDLDHAAATIRQIRKEPWRQP